MEQPLAYFEKYSKVYLMRALRHILARASRVVRGGRVGGGRGNLSASVAPSSKAECVLPYRLLKSLIGRPEISSVVMDSIMLDLVSCLKAQIDSLGGLTNKGKGTEFSAPYSGFPQSGSHKKSTKKASLKAEVVQSANLFFASLGRDFVWEWMGALLEKQGAALMSVVGASRAPELPGDGREGCGGEEDGGEREIVVEKDDREEKEDEDSNVVLETQSVSPVSDIVDSDLLAGTMKRGKGEKELFFGRDLSTQQLHVISSATSSSEDSKPLSLTTVLSLISFLLQVLPKVSHIHSLW